MAVTVYTMPNCRACEATKAWLDRRGVPYTVETLARSPDALALAAAHCITAAPVVVAGAEVWGGFRPNMIDRLKPNLTEPSESCEE